MVDCQVFVVFGLTCIESNETERESISFETNTTNELSVRPLKLTHPISNSHSSIMRPLNKICKQLKTATIKTKRKSIGHWSRVLFYIYLKVGRTFWSSRKFFKDSTVLKLISRDTARKSKILVGIWARCSSSDDDKSLFSCQITLPVSASRKIIQFLRKKSTIDSLHKWHTQWNWTHNGKFGEKQNPLTFGNHYGFFRQDLRLRYHSLFTRTHEKY